MGKPSSSCFKIMTCRGGDAVEDDDDDLALGEVKTSSDKHRWSFRKRSSKHRVLSNTVISEPISICSSKQTQDVLTAKTHSPKYSFLEKAQQQEKSIEITPLPSDRENTEAPPSLSGRSTTPVGPAVNNSEAPPSLSDRSTTPVGPALNDSDAIIIQAAIRGYLARKQLHKLKSVVKLQAAVRGHLVRRQAIGTLRCIQAIIRMQALVRARRACQLVEKLTSSEDTKFQRKGDSFEISNKASIEKLLSNGLARQLLETTPKTKPIYIKCDPSKSDSAWKWLERWMAVTSSGVAQQHEQNFNQGSSELEENVRTAELADSEPAEEIPDAVSSVFSDPKLASTELVMTGDSKHTSVTENIGNFEFQTPAIAPDNSFKSSLKDDVENLELKNEASNTANQDYTGNEMVNDESLDSESDSKQLRPNVSSEILVDTVPEKLDHSTERASSETLENEGKKSVIASRKSCNPAFVAAQSKFEELSLMSNVGRSVSSSNQHVASKSKTEGHNIQVDSFTNSNEAAVLGCGSDSRIQAAVSECGTEISISSTLDSLDKSEMEGGEIVLEIGALEKQNYSIGADAENASVLSNFGGNENGSTFSSEINRPQKPDGDDQTMDNSNASVDLVQVDQQPAESTTSDVQIHREDTIEHTRSPEGTPRSHATVPDLHGTPSSDVSVNTKKSKDSKMPNHRQRSHLVGKRSPSDTNNDSCGRSSTENLTIDFRIQKRRDSTGVAKSDHTDQEPRLSSSNSLPGYMQATASARAKAHVNTSQKSSPDLQDNQPKKRHSLPIENGKQSSSPRMQRSASQAQQSVVKGNGVHSPHNSAERRWQR